MIMKVRLGDYIQEYSVRNKAAEDIPVYSVTNTQGFCRDYFGKEVASKDKSTYKIVPKGCFAFNPSRINVGSVDWQRYEDRVIVSPLYNVFSVSPQLDQQYLFYYLKSDFALQRIRAVATGSVRDNLKLDMLYEFPIDIPEIETQKIIAHRIDIVKDVISLREKELQTLDNLIKARFVEMFGSFDLALQKAEWVPISQIGTVVGGSTPKTGVAEYWDGEYRWISPAELKADSGIIYDSVKKITKAGVDSCSLQELPIGTVILSSRAPIGKVAIAGTTFYCNQGFKNVICNDRVLPRYLYTLLLFNTEYLNSLGRGATFKEISKAIVENIRIPLPSLDRQQRFDSFVVQVDKSKFAVQKALEKAQLLFDSLMQKYFG